MLFLVFVQSSADFFSKSFTNNIIMPKCLDPEQNRLSLVPDLGPNILTHTSNAKCFRNVTLINIRGFAEIIVPARGYGIKRE